MAALYQFYISIRAESKITEDFLMTFWGKGHIKATKAVELKILFGIDLAIAKTDKFF